MNRAAAWTALAVGLLLVSTSGPFVVLSRIDPFALVLERMGIAAPLFFVWGAMRGGLSIPAGEGRRVALGGALLAAHFLLWLKAFDFTSFASNLLLLIAQPVVAALLGARVGERTSRETWIGLGIALLGLGIIVEGDFDLGTRALVGDGMSILAGVAISAFYLVTRRARAAMPLTSFMAWTLAAGAVVALPFVVLTGAGLGPRPAPAGPARPIDAVPSWVWLAGLVLVTTMGGHGLMNLAARGLRLFTVNVVIVLEPAIAIALGAVLLGESITERQVAGGLVLAVAVVVALLPEWREGRGGPPPAVVPE